MDCERLFSMLLSFDSAVERISPYFHPLFKSIRFHNPVTNQTPRIAEADTEDNKRIYY